MIASALRAAAFAALLTLSACAAVTAVQGPYSAGAFTVTLDRQWSDISEIMAQRPRNVRLLSTDGPLLNRLYIASAIEPDQFLVKPARREFPTPVFRADMSESELVEFVVDSVAALDYLRPEALDLRPEQFGGREGIRFEIRAQTAEGLDISGTAILARVGDRLHVMLYLAPSEHYYERLLPDVERVFASARFA